jgi:anti-sigma factor RsiW
MTEHDQQWQGLLHDWLDDALEPDERERLAAHLEQCEECAALLDELTALDRELRTQLRPVALDARFDARLFAQIDTESEASRLAARQRAQAEIAQELQTLTRHWRRTLATLIPGIIAGIALAFAGVNYFAAEWSAQLDPGATALGMQSAALLKSLLTAGIGACIGYAVARWLAPTPQ